MAASGDPLKPGLLAAALAPAGLVLALCGGWALLRPPLGPAGLCAAAAAGLGLGLFLGLRLHRRLRTSVQALDQGLTALASGRPGGTAAPDGATLLAGTRGLLERASAAVEARERSLEAFGAGLDPGRGAGLVGPRLGALERPWVSALCVVWLEADAALEALEPEARLAGLGRFYECVSGAVQAQGGTVLELCGGGVLAAWGAPVPAAESPVPALRAALALGSALPVLASQHRLRSGGSLAWSLGLSWGAAVAGPWGRSDRRRWALTGPPVARARGLLARPGGPWLDGADAGRLPPPFGALPFEGGFILNGPE